ncbi:hypothetical protein CBL_12541 [Carabus blaptoides fortunei]
MKERDLTLNDTRLSTQQHAHVQSCLIACALTTNKTSLFAKFLVSAAATDAVSYTARTQTPRCPVRHAGGREKDFLPLNMHKQGVLPSSQLHVKKHKHSKRVLWKSIEVIAADFVYILGCLQLVSTCTYNGTTELSTRTRGTFVRFPGASRSHACLFHSPGRHA